jgi:hypothetical protein
MPVIIAAETFRSRTFFNTHAWLQQLLAHCYLPLPSGTVTAIRVPCPGDD